MHSLNEFEVASVTGGRILPMTIGNGDLDYDRSSSAMGAGGFSRFDREFSSYTTGDSSTRDTIGYGGQAEGIVGGNNVKGLNPVVLCNFTAGTLAVIGGYTSPHVSAVGGALAFGCSLM